MKLSLDTIPVVTKAQIRELDEIMMEEIGIGIKIMMENDGRALAEVTKNTLEEFHGTSVLVVAGKGHNGGGGLVAARHLDSWDVNVKVIMSRSQSDLKQVTEDHYMIVKRAGIEIIEYSEDTRYVKELIDSSSVIVDSLLGYSVEGSAHGNEADLIEMINDSKKYIVSNDMPSGMHPDTFYPDTPIVRADRTMTIALPKIVFRDKYAQEFLGKLSLCDITVPDKVYDDLDIQVPVLFNDGYLVKVEH